MEIILYLTRVDDLCKSIQACIEVTRGHPFWKEINYCVHLLTRSSEFLQNFNSFIG